MSVLIKGMEMPTSCYDCAMHKPLYHTSYCVVANRNCTPLKEKKVWCPLVPVPPHGRLGDLDAICYQLEKQETIDGQPRAIRRARRIVEGAETIIPASEEDET